MGFYPRPLQYIADPPRYVVAVLIFKKVSGMIVGSCLHVDPIPHCIYWFSSSPPPPPLPKDSLLFSHNLKILLHLFFLSGIRMGSRAPGTSAVPQSPAKGPSGPLFEKPYSPKESSLELTIVGSSWFEWLSSPCFIFWNLSPLRFVA